MIDQTAVSFRPATASDAERIATLFTDEGYPAGPTDIVERLGRFEGRLARVVVADVGGEVLGFIALHAVPRFEHPDLLVRILALVVDPGVRELDEALQHTERIRRKFRPEKLRVWIQEGAMRAARDARRSPDRVRRREG